MSTLSNSTLDAMSNGSKTEFIDNRPKIEVDPKQIETWELMVMEEGKITGFIMVFARYLVRNGQPVSPEIPHKPHDEMTRAERAQVENSEAYRYLKRMGIAQLRAAAESFMEQAAAGF